MALLSRCFFYGRCGSALTAASTQGLRCTSQMFHAVSTKLDNVLRLRWRGVWRRRQWRGTQSWVSPVDDDELKVNLNAVQSIERLWSRAPSWFPALGALVLLRLRQRWGLHVHAKVVDFSAILVVVSSTLTMALFLHALPYVCFPLFHCIP